MIDASSGAADADSSSSSSSSPTVSGSGAGAFGLRRFSFASSPQQSSSPSASSCSPQNNTNNTSAASSLASSPQARSGKQQQRRPKFLAQQHKLEIAPREFKQLTTVSVVSLTSKLAQSAATTEPSSPPRDQQPQQQPQQQSQTQEEESISKKTTATATAAFGPTSSDSSSCLGSPNVSQMPQFGVPTPPQPQPQPQPQSAAPFHATLVHPNIYVGTALDAMDAAALLVRGILFVLNCAVECDFSDSVLAEPRIRTKSLHLRDTVGEDITRAFDDACGFIDEAVAAGAKVLVHCFAGVSRSPSIALAYLMRSLWARDVKAAQCAVVQQHQADEQRSVVAASPTMAVDSLASKNNDANNEDLSQQQPQQPQQHLGINHQKELEFPVTPNSASQRMMRFPSASSIQSSASSAGSGVAACSVASSSSVLSVASSTSSSSTSSSSSSSSRCESYYRATLDQMQKARPEVLPNFGFSVALREMDDQLLTKVSCC